MAIGTCSSHFLPKRLLMTDSHQIPVDGTGRPFFLWLRRASVGIATLLTFAVVGGWSYQSLASARDRRAFPTPGELVDVGGYRLHLHCIGEGTPSVLFDVGAGGSSADYADLHRALGSVTRTCFYDRAGLGWSDPPGGVDGVDRFLADLEAVVENVGSDRPLVLAGHSFGGYMVRLYAAAHPERTAALVLVDAAHERQWQKLPPENASLVRDAARQLRWAPLFARLGLIRLMSPAPGSATAAAQLRPEFLRALGTEMQVAMLMAERVARTHLKPSLPVTIITAGNSFAAFEGLGIPIAESNAVWLELQRDLLRLSTATVQYISPKASHHIDRDDPELIVRVVAEIVDTLRDEESPRATDE